MQCEQFALKEEKKKKRAFDKQEPSCPSATSPGFKAAETRKHKLASHHWRRERSTPGASPVPTITQHHSHRGDNNETLYFPHPYTYTARAFIFMQVSRVHSTATEHWQWLLGHPLLLITPLQFITRLTENLWKYICLSR